MENTDDNDSEIFYDAYERISECQKNSSLGGNSNAKISNVFSKERMETIYHDVIGIKEKENCGNIFGDSKEKQKYPICEEEKENVVSENEKDLNLYPNFENKFEIVKSSKNENQVKTIEKTNNATLRNKSEMMHNGIKEKDIDIEYLRQNLKQIQTKSKNIKDKHFQNLFELQCFQGDSQQILVAKISYGGKYLATGGLSGVLKIWIIYTEEDSLENYENRGIFSYLKFLNENAFRSYDVHKKEIIEINWHPRVN
jgi:WD40 repeat protein